MKKILITLLAISIGSNPALACTAVNIQAKDGSTITGRTMEWAFEMDWQLSYYPAGTQLTLSAPSNLKLPLIKTVSKYAVFGVISGSTYNSMVEGQNSAGLALSGNFLPGFTKYQTLNSQDKKYLSIIEFGKFVLSTFANITEVEKELPKYKVWAEKLPNLPVEPDIHFLISDKRGATLVIEFINGEMKLFNKTTGILTNAPTYDWHLTNIRNYLNLSNNQIKNINNSNLGLNVSALGQGNGAIGLPGDYTPPSRFIKANFLKNFANQPANSAEAVQLTGHILNNFDIAKGVIKDNKNQLSEYTQWVAIKNITKNTFYFADYSNRLNYVKIDLNKIFTLKNEFSVSINQINYPKNDISNSFIK